MLLKIFFFYDNDKVYITILENENYHPFLK